MPTVLRVAGHRFYFHSNEPGEPPHVQVDRESKSAKFWLTPVAAARNFGFSGRELRRIDGIVKRNQTTLVEAWRDFFGS